MGSKLGATYAALILHKETGSNYELRYENHCGGTTIKRAQPKTNVAAGESEGD